MTLRMACGTVESEFGSHGASATPTSIQYFTGHWGLGRLDTWFRSSTLKVGSRGSLTFTVDNTVNYYCSC